MAYLTWDKGTKSEPTAKWVAEKADSVLVNEAGGQDSGAF